MHGAPGTSLALCHSSSHVTSRKHWHTGRHILSLCPLFLPRLNRRFFLPIQFKNWQSETTRLRVWHKKKKKNFLCSQPANTHTTDINVQRIMQFKQWVNSVEVSVSSDRLRYFLFAFIPLSLLNESLRISELTHTMAWQCTFLLSFAKRDWVVSSHSHLSVITNVKELFIPSNPLYIQHIHYCSKVYSQLPRLLKEKYICNH